jgi:toxin CcdB
MVSRWHQFDVFANPDKRSAESHPYLIILQSEIVPGIETCVVAPLVSPRSLKFFERLLPKVTVKGVQYTILTPNMAAIRKEKLGKPIANLEAERYRILAAIDLVFVGI